MARKRSDNSNASSANRNLQDSETVELKENVKKLQDDFSSLPMLLFKRTLFGDNDLAKPRQQLQEFTQIKNPLLKIPMPAAKHVTRNSKGGNLDDSPLAMTQSHSKEQNWSREGKMLCYEKK